MSWEVTENGDKSPVFCTGDKSGICCKVRLDGGACQFCAIEWNERNLLCRLIRNTPRIAGSDREG